MTMPDERYNALARVPGVLMAYACRPGPLKKRELMRVVTDLLRHYPSDHDLKSMAKKCPDLLQLPTKR